jgi:two-component SAPR family response regulator
MKILLLDPSTYMIVDTLATVLSQQGHEARAVHKSAEALRLIVKFKPDWVFTILNNITDAKPADVILEILRIYPSCKFVLTAGRPMPEFEDELWKNGYALTNVLPLPLNTKDLSDHLNNKESMIIRAAEGQIPKFIMFRE